jgi:Domain of Unknown Function (DUF928)
MKSRMIVLGSILAVSAYGFAQTAAPAPAAAPAAPAKPARVRTQLAGFDITPQTGKSANQIGGASRDLGSPRLYAPHAGKAFSRHPVFSWETAEPNQTVTFRLSSMNGQVIYEATLTDNQLTYPDDGVPLLPGSTYHWTIVPQIDIMGAVPAPVSILIVGGAERDSIAAELKAATGDDGAAKVYIAHRLWYDSVAEYTHLIATNPSVVDYYAARGTIYDQIPATNDLATQDWAQVP